ncbi:hypothetical protein ACTA71_000433 [Dictyostelium dimigraforme]
MERNSELFKKIWSNNIIKKEILLHLKHDKKVFYDYVSFWLFNKKEYVSVLKLCFKIGNKELNLFKMGYINIKHLIMGVENYKQNLDDFSFNKIKIIEFKDSFCGFKYGNVNKIRDINRFEGVEQLSIFKYFNENIEVKDLPKSLKSLKLGALFNSTITIDGSLVNLKQLEFGRHYNRPLSKGNTEILDSKIEHLSLGCSFNQPIIPNQSLPLTLKTLDLGKRFNIELQVGSIPFGVETLYLGRYNYKLKPNIIPKTVTFLDFGTNFNSEIEIGSIPGSVKTIILRGSFKQLQKGVIPSTVKYLYLPHSCNSIHYSEMYDRKSLDSLSFGKNNNWIKEF